MNTIVFIFEIYISSMVDGIYWKFSRKNPNYCAKVWESEKIKSFYQCNEWMEISVDRKSIRSGKVITTNGRVLQYNSREWLLTTFSRTTLMHAANACEYIFVYTQFFPDFGPWTSGMIRCRAGICTFLFFYFLLLSICSSRSALIC